MSLCDKCYDPGRCCKHLGFYTESGGEITFWSDEPLDTQLRDRLEEEDVIQPFVLKDKKATYKDENGREYFVGIYSCTQLLPNGRCGAYENRPILCRTFIEGDDPLCVHFRGAEGGEGAEIDADD